MRIAFVGKGGSGKTTLSSLFCAALVEEGKPVLAIDADINQHLAGALGASDLACPALADDLPLIKEYLRGKNPLILSAGDMIKTTPPGSGSRLLRFGERNPIVGTFGRNVAGLTLLATGQFCEEDVGVKCYHSKTGAVELLLNHLIDGHGQYVVVDMTAGADSFASGLFTKFDLTAVVVEPTEKSLSVYEQYRGHAEPYGVRLAVIANKVEGPEDVEFVRSRVGGALVGSFGASQHVRALEKGRTSSDGLERENRAVLDVLRHELDGCQKDWEKFRRQAIEFHLRNASSWANAAVGRDLAPQVDNDFRYPEE